MRAASEQQGVDRHTLRDLELGQGRTPRYPTLAKIAEGYGVDVEELLEEPVSLVEGSQLDADIKQQGAVAQRSMEEYGATPESLKDPQKRARMDKNFETLKELRWIRYELIGVPEPLATIVASGSTSRRRSTTGDRLIAHRQRYHWKIGHVTYET